MESYLNDSKLKTLAIERLKNAIASNMLVQEKKQLHFYEHWENGKGTVIGCIGAINDIEAAAKMFGIPVQLLTIQDHIFQYLEQAKAHQFALEFLEAIPVGGTVDTVWKQYFIWLLAEVEHSTMDALKHIDLAKGALELSVKTLKRMLTAEIPTEELEGIVKEINAYRSIVGRAADAGAVQPEYAGWELAKAHWAIQSATNASYIKHLLPQGGPPAMWEFLGEQLISIIRTGKVSRNTYDG